MNLVIAKDADELAARAADLILQEARAAIAVRGQFTIVLAGGRTPAKTYSLLAQPARAAALDWADTYIFMGDERIVPFNDAASNYGMACRTLLEHAPVPDANAFPVPTGAGDRDRVAALYAETIAEFFEIEESAELPIFDLILLGLGDDGHTASLFPNMPTLQEKQAWVVGTPPGTLPPPVDRVTFTYPLINAARHVVFLVSGEAKAAPLEDIIEGGASPRARPAAGVHPLQGSLTWLVDEAAASRLTHRPPAPHNGGVR